MKTRILSLLAALFITLCPAVAFAQAGSGSASGSGSAVLAAGSGSGSASEAPVLAPAAPEAPPATVTATATATLPAKATAGARLLDQVVEIVAYALALLLSLLAGKLILAIERKFKVNVPDPMEAYLNKLIDKGVAYAAEQGHKASASAGEKLAGNEKLDLAADFVATMAEKKKVAEMGKDKLKKLIEARLNTKRVA